MLTPMATSNSAPLATLVSEERLSVYRKYADKKYAQLYEWNIEASASLFADVARFEVIVRNAFSRQLAIGFLSSNTEWFLQTGLFSHNHQIKLKEAIESRRRRHSQNLTEGEVISELNFGFWRFLCDRRYHTSLWVKASLHKAFPNHPLGSVSAVRCDTEQTMLRINALRNRIAHHEPIFNRDLKLDFDSLIEMASWIDHSASTWIRGQSHTPKLLDDAPLTQHRPA